MRRARSTRGAAHTRRTTAISCEIDRHREVQAATRYHSRPASTQFGEVVLVRRRGSQRRCWITGRSAAACNDPSGAARYVPAFAIPYDPDATPQQGKVTTSTRTYLVKWLDREIRFAQKATST